MLRCDVHLEGAENPMIDLRNLISILCLSLAAVFVQSPASADDLVETATKAPNLSTFVKAVKQAGLEDALKGAGPYTVFAPTNEAFAKVPKRLFAALFHPSNKEGLGIVMKYHVLSGKLFSKDFAGKSQNFKALQGEELAVDATKEFMVDKAKVVTADIEASNGVLHMVDTLILPPDLRGSF